MLKQVKATIENEKIIAKGDAIVVAVSGGPDSIALLHVLNALKEEWALTLYVCHLNHMLRGEDADADANYVKEFADALGIKSYIFTRDITGYAKEHQMGFEEAAREARYALFDYVMEQTGANKIAVGQNMNDQAETVLMRLFRGAGLEGLTAIKTQRDHVIRPLLHVDRKTIERYIEAHQLTTRLDKTNLESDYTRNKIRLELIPYIQEHFNEQVIERLHETSRLLNVDRDYIDAQVKQVMREQIIDAKKIPLSVLSKLHPALFSRVLRELIFLHAGTLKEIGAYHIKSLMALIEQAKHGTKMIIKDHVFEICYETLMIYKDHNDTMEKTSFVIGEVFEYNGQCIESLQLPVANRDKDSITIDVDKIKGQLYVRTRLPGDRFKPLGMTGQKKLSNFFIDMKIPAPKRDDILLLCDEDSIIWVVGYRMSEDYKIDGKTQTRLSFRYHQC